MTEGNELAIIEFHSNDIAVFSRGIHLHSFLKLRIGIGISNPKEYGSDDLVFIKINLPGADIQRPGKQDQCGRKVQEYGHGRSEENNAEGDEYGQYDTGCADHNALCDIFSDGYRFFAIVDTSQQDCFIVSSYQEKVNDLQSVKLLLQIEKNVIVYVQGGDCYG